jgi:hypothetical protein
MAIVIAFGVLLLALMLFGWRARRRRQAGVAAPHAAPAELGRSLGTFEGKYVATTSAGEPLDRIAVHNLGFRGAASLTVTESGLLVQRPGSDDAWIPKAELRGWRRATWTIDRVVEPDGLHLVEWALGEKPVDSYFRMATPAAFESALDALLERTTT